MARHRQDRPLAARSLLSRQDVAGCPLVIARRAALWQFRLLCGGAMDCFVPRNDSPGVQ